MRPHEFLRHWRRAHGITQMAAARAADVSQAAWSGWERNLTVPQANKLFLLERMTEGQLPASAWSTLGPTDYERVDEFLRRLAGRPDVEEDSCMTT
ncbi:helix-turn-helix domain-containing protein [Pendulispora brunnea]|uniref:Helix-turn-helix domain-containing protein n=1 Tax=Pendulispora brunnea TaxID=2905690 RepID=A0ABZ2KMB4_9BACT